MRDGVEVENEESIMSGDPYIWFLFFSCLLFSPFDVDDLNVYSGLCKV